jgi:hypothetical protein
VNALLLCAIVVVREAGLFGSTLQIIVLWALLFYYRFQGVTDDFFCVVALTVKSLKAPFLQSDCCLCHVCVMRLGYAVRSEILFVSDLSGLTEHADGSSVCGNWKDTKFTSPLTWAPDLFRLCLVGIRMKVWCVRVMCLIQHNIVFACLVYAVCWLSTLTNLL